MVMNELQQIIDAAYERRTQLTSSTVDSQMRGAIEASMDALDSAARLRIDGRAGQLC